MPTNQRSPRQRGHAEAPEDPWLKKYDPSQETPESEPTDIRLQERARRLVVPTTAAQAPAPRPTRAQRRAAGKPHPARSFFTVAAVAALVATVAGARRVQRRQQHARRGGRDDRAAAGRRANAQSLVVASEAIARRPARGGYAATTPEEIQAKKDEEAAKAAATASASLPPQRRRPTRRATPARSLEASTRPLDWSSADLPNNFGTPYADKGTDYMADRGTPIYLIADGVVVASDEDGPGWGVYVKIAHNIGGQSVTSSTRTCSTARVA